MPRPRPFAAAFVLAALSVTPVHADSVDVERHLIIAEDAFLDVEYDTALEALAMAERETGATDDQIARVLALRGTIHVLQEDTTRARAAYVRLLTLDQGYRLPEVHPPRAAEFLEEVRAETAARPEVTHQPPRSFRDGEPMEIRAEVRGASPRHAVLLYFRRRGDRSYSTVELSRDEGDHFAATVPAFAALGVEQTGQVEYFIVVTLGEERIAHAGTPRRPLSFVVTSGGGRGPDAGGGGQGDLTSRWWFWTAIGAAAAVALGVGLGLGFGLQTGRPEGAAEVTFHFPPD